MPFHKFVPREGKQGQINSGKLSTYQPEVKRIACDRRTDERALVVIIQLERGKQRDWMAWMPAHGILATVQSINFR